MTFKLLEGVVMADTAFEASGKDLNELFEQSALAVESIMVSAKSIKKEISRDITLDKKTIEDLLYSFLNELVYLKDAEQFLVKSVTAVVSKNKGWLLHAKLDGAKLNKKMTLGTDIKAITLHKFSVKESKSGWVAQVVVDV